VIARKTQRLLTRRAGVLLDVSLGGEPQLQSVTMRKGGDINHDPLKVPFPLPDACAHTAVVTHVLEYLEPGAFYRWWDELWRIVQPGGLVFVSGPYGGDESHGWIADPTHRTRIVEQSFAWLDPRTPFYELHAATGRPKPRPWFPLHLARVPGTHGTFGYNAQIRKPLRKEMR
jgi:hypothetical protein